MTPRYVVLKFDEPSRGWIARCILRGEYPLDALIDSGVEGRALVVREDHWNEFLGDPLRSTPELLDPEHAPSSEGGTE